MSDHLEDTIAILKLELPVAPPVLIVDDDALVLARLEELVTTAGYGVRTATNGVEALASLENSPASIVITDITMPCMDGLELNVQISECLRRDTDWCARVGGGTPPRRARAYRSTGRPPLRGEATPGDR